MNAAEPLPHAASLMRERATLALDTEGMEPWYEVGEVTSLTSGQIRAEDDAHMLSWHPTAALAVADLIVCPCEEHALAVARAYLGDAE